MIPTLKRCCCCTLKRGCLVTGCFCGVKATVMVFVASFFAHMGHNNARKAETEENRRLNIAVEVTSIIMAVFNGVEIFSNVLLLKGTIDSKPKFLFPWMVLCFVDLIFSCFLFISAIVFTIVGESSSEFVYTLYAEPFNIGLNIYFHLVVHSYYKKLKSVPPNVQEVGETRPSTVKIGPSQPVTPLTRYLLQVPNLPPIQHPPHKKLPKLTNTPGTEHFGPAVSWIEP